MLTTFNQGLIVRSGLAFFQYLVVLMATGLKCLKTQYFSVSLREIEIMLV
jgi:hypothetical protein